MHGDTVLHVLLYVSEAIVPMPILSGQVFAMIDGTHVPLAGQPVVFTSGGSVGDAMDVTGSDGRYSTCGLPLMPGQLYMYCASEVSVGFTAVDIRLEQVADIDATAFYECLL